jgi:hypothetical protein
MKNIGENMSKENHPILSSGQTSFTDKITVALRADDMILIQFLSELPGMWAENSRTMIRIDTARSLVEVLAKVTNHYPAKPEIEPPPPAKSKRKVATKQK